MKVTMIIGEPGAGKSLLMKELMRLDKWEFSNSTKYIPQHWCRARQACILGRYDDLTHKYPGTDRMSMAAQPKVIQFLRANTETNFLFEGDRLGNESMIRAMLNTEGVDLEVIRLVPMTWVLDKRRVEGRQDQNERFWRSRRTKIMNLHTFCSRQAGIGNLRYQPDAHHNNLSETHNLIAYLRKYRV